MHLKTSRQFESKFTMNLIRISNFGGKITEKTNQQRNLLKKRERERNILRLPLTEHSFLLYFSPLKLKILSPISEFFMGLNKKGTSSKLKFCNSLMNNTFNSISFKQSTLEFKYFKHPFIELKSSP